MNFKTFLHKERRDKPAKKILVNVDEIFRVSNDVPTCSLILHMMDKDIPVVMPHCVSRKERGEAIGEYELFQEFRRILSKPEI